MSLYNNQLFLKINFSGSAFNLKKSITRDLMIFSWLILSVFVFTPITNLKAQSTVLLQNPGTGNYIVPAGVNQIIVEAWGGGGAGGFASNKKDGGGGAGGSYVRDTLPVTPGQSFNYSIAAQRIGATSGDRLDGYPTWFGSQTTIYAQGGQGGEPGPLGGAAGIGSTTLSYGSAKFAGGSGANGTSRGAGGGGAGSTGGGGSASSTAAGTGTADFGGNGGARAGNNEPGYPGVAYGGGGSGGSAQGSGTYAGGAGAPGMIRITYAATPVLTLSAISTPSCTGITPGTGTITASTSGGTAPYQYNLNGGSWQSAALFSNLSPATYTLYVKDAANLTKNIPVTVQSATNGMPVITADVTNASCPGSADGAIRVTNIPTAIEFKKTDNDYIDLGGQLLNNLSAFTLEGWISVDKSLATGTRTWGFIGQNDAIEFGIMDNTILQLWSATGGTLNIPLSAYPDGNGWHHLAGTGDGQRMIVYIDGVEVGRLATTVSNYGSSVYNSMIGGRIWDADGNYLDGRFLKAGIWNRALSATEIATLASTEFKQYTSSDAGLMAGYNFFEGEGTTLSKIGTVSTNGTFVNTPEWKEVFTYKWIKTGSPTFSATTKHLTAITSGEYMLTASFPGICPITGIWTINNTGINKWTGAADINWNNISNWTCTIPDLTIDAIIPSGLARYPLLSTGNAGLCRNLSVSTEASVTITGNSLSIAGTIINSGTITATDGTIIMKGASAQIIPANTFAGNTIKSLTIDNIGGVTLNGTLKLSGILYAKSGNLQTNGFLTLLSNATGTALIDGSAAGQVLGNVTMERYLPIAFGYKYFSSPFTNATVGQFADDIDLAASFATLYYYDENQISTGWEKYITSSNQLIAGKGYALNFGNTVVSKTVSTTGVVNNGTIGPFTVYNHNQPYTKGYYLAGNPYPSPIDWNAAGWTKTNIDNALYYFDAGNTDQYLGTYSTYINGISSNGIANSIIPSQQGFFIHVTDGIYPTQGTLTFTNSVRVTSLNPVFHKNTSVTPQSYVRLSAHLDNSEAPTDYMVIYYDDYALNDFEPQYDALKIMNTETNVPNLYALTAAKREVSIKALPFPVDNSQVIDLGIALKAKGSITIKAVDIKDLPSGYKVYLKDNYTGQIRELQKTPEYTFNINNETFTDRLSLIISNQELTQEALGTGSFNAFTKDGNVILNMKVKEEQVLVQITDLSGRMMIQQSVYGEGNHTIGKNLNTGIYIVTIFTDMGTISKKIYLN